MRYYLIIETHGGALFAAIVTDTDGNNRVFDTYEEAAIEAADCQQGLFVELND